VSADTLHDELIVIDGLEMPDWARSDWVGPLRRGGVTCINGTLSIWENARETLNHIARLHQRVRESSDDLVIAQSTEDIVSAKRDGKTAILMGFQNTDPLENDLDLVEVFWRLGVRVIQLTYNARNSIGTGCWEGDDSGLSSHVGRNFVREFNQFGILIDLSHCNNKTVLDTAELSQQPVAITHGNPHSFVGDSVELARRNRSDDALRAVARSGGIVGLSMYPKIAPDGPQCTLQRFCEMVAYTSDLVGVDHVGVGTDHAVGRSRDFLLWCRMGRWSRESAIPVSTSTYPDWISTPAEIRNVTQGLLDKGFDREEVRKVMGGNFLRVFQETLDRSGFTEKAPTAAGRQ
jgi:microsomal dipeptidase-like Zn-dependent dipeptidase